MPKKRSLESAGISDAQYLQIMERVAEQNYKDWGLPNSDAALVKALNDNTYNYRGYYNKYPNGEGNAVDHWTDEFKTVYHPTFSKESKYSGKVSQYNPKGLVGGTWSEETFIPASWQRNKFEKGGSTKKPVTTGGAGYIPDNYGTDVINYIRNRLYHNITPITYYKPLERVYDAIINNKSDTIKHGKTIKVNDKDVKEQLDNIWATYLQIPENNRTPISKRNKLVPNKDGSYSLGHIGTIYDTVMDEGVGYDRLIDYKGNGNLHRFSKEPMKLGEYKWLNAGDVYLGNYGIRRGYDNNGEYIQYEDTWDISPYKKTHIDRFVGSDLNLYGQNIKPSTKDKIVEFVTENKNDASFGIGRPLQIKGKFYLDDYYGLSEPTHSTYLPEVTVTGRKRHKDGGSIHIKPSKRGTFTAAATKHGMEVQEFARRVLANRGEYSPAMVKKANFARNASKWNN